MFENKKDSRTCVLFPDSKRHHESVYLGSPEEAQLLGTTQRHPPRSPSFLQLDDWFPPHQIRISTALARECKHIVYTQENIPDNTLAFIVGVVAVIHSIHKVLLQNNSIPWSPHFLRQTQQQEQETREIAPDRADAVGAPLVDGVLLQVRLDLCQRPRPGPRHHRPAAALPAACSMLQMWLHPCAQLLLHRAMARTSSSGCCCRNGGRQAAAGAHYLTPKRRASPLLHTLFACFCCTCTFLQTDKGKWIMAWTCTVQKIQLPFFLLFLDICKLNEYKLTGNQLTETVT